MTERAFKKFYKNEGTLYLACNDKKAFSLLQTIEDIHFGHVRMYVTPYNIFWIILRVGFGDKLYRQIVGIPMGTNCAPHVADLFLFCYERDFMTSLSIDNQADIIELFNSTSRYFDDLLNIDDPHFERMVNQIYPPELQLNKANTSDTEAPFLDLHLSISDGFVSSQIYKKRNDFVFDIVIFLFGMVNLWSVHFTTYKNC